MRQVTQKVCLGDGTQSRERRDLYRLLNHNIQKLLNQAERAGEYGFPVLYCNTDVFPDYLALFCQPGYYHKTRVCVFIPMMFLLMIFMDYSTLSTMENVNFLILTRKDLKM